MRQVKDLEHPLKIISFLFRLDNKIGYDKNDALKDGFELNLFQDSNKLFSLITNETRLEQMRREFDKKCADIQQQRWCSVQRKLQIEKYERDQKVDTSVEVEISGVERNPVVMGEIRMLRNQ